ncbi:MAG: hypothetical protein WCE23_15985 [Candidatus Binatus sp.]|uniref:hypothetical protein n=1 Tax=Candidatus Binatus sp. TaxID=2811406 RepID=UPI003C754B7A
MKATKLITVAMFAAMLFAIAGRASAGTGAGHGGGHASSAHSASHAAHRAGMGSRAGMSQRNRRFSSTYANSGYYPYFGNGYYGNGYWGNGYYGNADEADWSEEWTSLSEDNDGPYARSTRENPQGQARMWEFPDK